MKKQTPLPGPLDGFTSWLDFALYAMDKHNEWHPRMWMGRDAEDLPDRAEILALAARELRALRAAAGQPDTFNPDCVNWLV